MAQTIKYRGLEFNLQSSGNAQADGRYHAELTFKMGNKTISKKYSSKTLEGLERRHEEKKASLFDSVAKVSRAAIQENASSRKGVTLPLLYAAWREEIGAEAGWKPTTLARKETGLYKTFDQLGRKPIRELTFDDFVQTAAQVACGKSTIKDATIEQMKKYKELLQFLCMILDIATIADFYYENPIREYVEQIKTPTDERSSLKKEFDAHSIEPWEERKLYKCIMEGLDKNGLMFGAALVLFEGIEVKEACELRFRDIIRFRWLDEPMYVLRIMGKGRKNKLELAEQKKIRRMPMHRQLAELYEEWKNITEKRLKEKKSGTELKDAHLVRRGQNLTKGVEPELLRAFLKELFEECGIKAPEDITLADGEKVTFRFDCARYLRRNFEQHLLDCGATDDEVNVLMGRAAKTTDARYYRDWNSDLCLLNLKLKMDRWSIDSEKYCAGDLTGGNSLSVSDTGNTPQIMSAQLIAEQEGVHRIIIRSKKGMDLSVSLTPGGERNE